MRTQVMNSSDLGTPWLEYFPADGGPAERTPVDTFPFSIGRNDTTDLQIKSGRVSREHAVLELRGGKFRVRDLGSTNGTLLNGRPVKESDLNDGDLLQFADYEYTFYAGDTAEPRDLATQVMGDSRAAGESAAQGDRLSLRLRRLHEMATHGGVVPRWEPVVDLQEDRVVGYQVASAPWEGESLADETGRLFASQGRAVRRVRRLLRMVAAEQAAGMDGNLDIFFDVLPAEADGDTLLDHLEQLRDLLSDEHRLAVQVPFEAVGQSPEMALFRQQVKQRGFRLAYDELAAGKAQVMEHQADAPDFFMLAPALLRGLRGGGDRQRQIKLVIGAARDVGSEVVATGIQTEADAALCLDLGCRLARGELYNDRTPAGSKNIDACLV